MDELRFWTMVEEAWEAAGMEVNLLRWNLAGMRELAGEQERLLDKGMDRMIVNLRQILDGLEAEELMGFDRILERKLYEIDREDVHEYTDGSDDGFLYARGFIVAMGKGYYEAVLNDPSKALLDCGLEEMCYISWHIYEDKFGEMPRSRISRESCSNKAGWGF